MRYYVLSLVFAAAAAKQPTRPQILLTLVSPTIDGISRNDDLQNTRAFMRYNQFLPHLSNHEYHLCLNIYVVVDPEWIC